MCGIGGILRTDGQPIPEEWLDAIDARIAWRGPDGCGRFRDRVEVDDPKTPGGKRIVEVALVHRRLSIIDHAGGHQPMVSERDRNESEGLVAVVFNGCIYNHRELRKELEGKGHGFITDHSDTEVLIHGWREWREKLPEHLEGMYAFGVWDRSKAHLFLATDEFGEKPLWTRSTESAVGEHAPHTPVVAFASEPACLSALPGPDEVCGDWCRQQWLVPFLLRGYTSMFIPGPHLSDIECQGPNSATVILSNGESDLRDALDQTENSGSVAPLNCEEMLQMAVQRRLEADVALGCFLSGGVDSSLVATFAKKHKPDLRTFCVRMPDERYDESSHAERVAKHLGTNHTTLDVAMRPAEDLVHLIDLMGQPFGDSSILPTYWVSKSAREHVKVALSGDGGDELFVGYERYLAARFLAQHHRLLSRIPTALLHRSHPKTRRAKLARLAEMARDYPRLGLVAMEAIFTCDDLALLEAHFSHPEWRCSIDEDHDLEDDLASISGCIVDDENPDAIALLREFDVEKYLPYDLLRKVDTASMAAGLEVRCPFLDRDLARVALSAPIEQLMPGGRRKGLLRSIARKYLPKEIVDRPKMGFAIPIGEWFRNDNLPHKGAGMKTLLLDHLNSAEPFGPMSLNRKAVQRFIDEHMSGKRDHGQRLFTLLTLSIWARQATADSPQRTQKAQNRD